MLALFTNFTNGKELEDCIFSLPKNIKGLHQLDTIYDSNKLEKQSDWFYTFEEVKNMKMFYLRNKGSSGSTYKTCKGFLNRLKKELKL